MSVSKIHSFQFQFRLFLCLPLFFCCSGFLTADPADPGKWAGLTYSGDPDRSGRTVGWARAAKENVKEKDDGEIFVVTGELRQQANGRSPVFLASLSWRNPLFECFAGSRDIPGKDPVFFSDPALPGSRFSSDDSASSALPGGRRSPVIFLRPGLFLFPGLWGARSLEGPGFYLHSEGIFLAYSPRNKVWGAQLRSGSPSRYIYRLDFEGKKKEISGFGFFRLLANGESGRSEDAAFAFAQPLLAVNIERSSAWDRFRYREATYGEPFRAYRSWFVSAVSYISVFRMEVAGQDEGDAAFRVASLDRRPPAIGGWYLIPAIRWQGLRLYREETEHQEVRFGLGPARVIDSGVFRILLLGGTARSLSMEATAGLRFEEGFFEMGLTVTGSEDRDSFTYLPIGIMGQGRSRFYDRASQLAVLRAGFPGFDISLEYCVRRNGAGELRDRGYLRASASHPL